MYTNSNILSGFALLGQDLHNSSAPEYKHYLSAASDPSVADGLISALGGLKSNVSGLLAWADGEAIPLRWGEVIPLSFLQHGLLDAGTRVVVWSMPTRRYVASGAPMTDELLRVGRAVASYLEKLPQRVAVVISR